MWELALKQIEPMAVETKPIFQRPVWVAVFALTAAVAWGFAYPLIKLGYAEFGILPAMTGSKMLFAGVRFTVAGAIVLAMAGMAGRSFGVMRRRDWWYIALFCLVNTTLHYAFFYIGLSHSAGSRAAILNSLSVFAVVIMACLFFKTDRMTVSKLAGCVMGFAGILLLNALCGAAASLLTRGLGRRVDVTVGTGYSLALGGILLVVVGLALGGSVPAVTPLGLLWLCLLIGISAIGFSLYNKLLTCNPIGKVAIYNSLIPVVGAVSSCLCLHEPFYVKYVVAGLLAAAGIYVINRAK